MMAAFPSWFGRMLRGMRAGLDKTFFKGAAFASVPSSIVVASSAFEHGGSIPRVHSGDGAKTSPPLSWSGVPAQAKSVVLFVEDADSPTSAPFVHLIAWDLPGRDGGVAAGACDGRKGSSVDGGVPLRLGRNGLFGRGYTPPDPPPGHGPHRYVFQVYALDRPLAFRSTPGRRQLLNALRGATIAKGALEGVYERV